MKTTLLAAAAILGLSSQIAFAAGEANFEPFPNRVPGVVAFTGGRPVLADTSQDAFPAHLGVAGQVRTAFSNEVLPGYGSEGAVQTANSLPLGFDRGTAPYEQARILTAWNQDRAAKRALIEMAQKATTLAQKAG